MKTIKLAGLCVIALCAIGAYTASSAFALPEWGKCVEVGSAGNYTGPNCTKAEKAKPKGSGTYEWKKGSELPNLKFTIAGSDEPVLHVAAEFCLGEELFVGRMTREKCAALGGERFNYFQQHIECESQTGSGETIGKSGVQAVRITFTGCSEIKTAPEHTKCGNVAPEVIETEELKGKLGYTSKTAHEVGLLLEPAKKKGTFASFTCEGGNQYTIGVGNKKEGTAWTSSGCVGPCPGTTPEEEKHGGYDGFISTIGPLNQMTSSYTQEANVEGEEDPHNTPTAFEGKHIDLLEDYWVNGLEPEFNGMWSPAGVEGSSVDTLQPAGEENEIKA
jgi:hypothetical protein